MNLRQLEVFISVVEQGSFSGAARESLLTQSTVSQHIAGLEQELGVQLLERSRNGIRLTEPGKILLKHARHVAGELRATHEAIRRYQGEEETTLRIGVSTVPGGYLVPPVLAKLCERYPKLHAVLYQGDSRETAERIASREVEAGVVGSRFEERGFLYTPVGRDQISLIAPSGHPWTKRSSISLKDLAACPLVMRAPGSGTGKTVVDALQKAGLRSEQLHIRAHVGGNEAVKASILTGLGFSFLSEVVVRRDIERGDLAVIPVDGLDISRPFYLARRSGRPLGPVVGSFWDAMLATYGSPGTA
jgi:LysR family transcriptional regulator, low CO2-responsive transcriptional regulator